MKTVNVSEAKTHLSELLDLAVSGEDVVIARGGRPLVKLIPYKSSTKPRKPGYWKGKVKISKDFDALPDSLLKAFEGEPE